MQVSGIRITGAVYTCPWSAALATLALASRRIGMDPVARQLAGSREKNGLSEDSPFNERLLSGEVLGDPSREALDGSH